MNSYQSGRSGSSASISCSSFFVALLAVAFIVLKLTEFIDWDWIWVLTPIWGSVCLSLVLLVVVLVFIAITHK